MSDILIYRDFRRYLNKIIKKKTIMKNTILIVAILFAGLSGMKAQSQNEKPDYQRIGHNVVTSGVNNIATTTLTIKLNAIQSISVNTSNVSLVYTTVGDYTNGVRSGVIDSHLKIYSTGGYKVNVGYSGAVSDYSENTIGGLNANAMFESINIVVNPKVTANTSNTHLQPLAATNGAIISSDRGVFGETFHIGYQGSSGVGYMNSIKGNNPRTYTATVTYTILPM